jgi:hypothetical protein
MKYIFSLVLVLVLVSCGKNKEETITSIEEKKADHFEVVFDAIYKKDDSLSLVIKRDGFWDWEAPTPMVVKGSDTPQNLKFDLKDVQAVENIDITFSTNKEQECLKVIFFDILKNGKSILDGKASNLNYLSMGEAVGWDEVNLCYKLMYDKQYLPKAQGNVQLESFLNN